eukprot:599597-Pyramimonas_sp.AAC.1
MLADECACGRLALLLGRRQMLESSLQEAREALVKSKMEETRRAVEREQAAKVALEVRTSELAQGSRG